MAAMPMSFTEQHKQPFGNVNIDCVCESESGFDMVNALAENQPMIELRGVARSQRVASGQRVTIVKRVAPIQRVASSVGLAHPLCRSYLQSLPISPRSQWIGRFCSPFMHTAIRYP